MRRVLMVSPHFPPDTSAGAHRVRLLAPYLPQHGWEPTVVTVDSRRYEGRLDPALERLVPRSLRVVRAAAWPATLTRPIGFGDLGLRAFAGLRAACDALLRDEEFHALFITIYPTYPALLGPGLKARHRVPFVLDYQDPWVGAWGLEVGGGPGGRPDVRSRMSRRIATWLEPAAVRAADALTAVSARTYEDVLARNPDARPRVCAAIPLGADPRDIDALETAPHRTRAFDAADGLLHVSYVGTLLPKGLAIARLVLEAIARLRDHDPALYARLRLHFIGTSNTREQDAEPRVLPLARDAGVADVVTETPARVDYLDALDAQRQSAAILLMGSSEPHYTPSKVYPALLTGRPIVAVYHPASPVVALLNRASQAQVVTLDGGEPEAASADAIASLLRTALTSPVAAVREDVTSAPWSAPVLAGDLAKVLDTVAA